MEITLSEDGVALKKKKVDPSLHHIQWDMSLPPTSARRLSGTGIISSLKTKFKDLATHPPVKHMQIIIPAGPEEPLGLGILWPNIVIQQQTDITLGDVLWAIYDFFRVPLSDAEVGDVKNKLAVARAHFPYYESLEYTANQRAKVSHEIGALSATDPFRRIDCMGSGQRFFSTLFLTYNENGPNSRWWLVLYGQSRPRW